MGRKLGLVTIAIAIAIYASSSIGIWSAGESASNFDKVLWVFAATLFSLGFWLVLFGKLKLGPFFTIDLSKDRPSLIVGFRGFRVLVESSPRPGSLQFGRVYLYLSFMTRMLAKLALVGLFYNLLAPELSQTQIIFACTILFFVLFGLERKFNERFAVKTSETEALAVSGNSERKGDVETEI